MQLLKTLCLEIVEADLRAAEKFYDSWKSNGAKIFRDKLREAVSWLEWNPEMFPKQFGSFRRAILRHSFYAVYYVIETKQTTVVVVLDMRRHPAEISATIRGRS